MEAGLKTPAYESTLTLVYATRIRDATRSFTKERGQRQDQVEAT